MKYLITESQFDNVIFKYLDNQDFIRIGKNNNIYFVNSENDKFAQIKFREVDGQCYVHYNLINEISMFFSLDILDSKEVIGRWVENTLQMKVTNTCAREMNISFLVENTLQMKVTNTWKTHPQARIVV